MASRRTRTIAAFGLLVCATAALVPLGCAGIESVPLKEPATSVGPHVPNATAARLRECVEEFGSELPGAGLEVHVKAKVDAEGRVLDVTTDAPHADLAGCVRVASRAMTVPPELLAPWVAGSLAGANGQTKETRGLVGNVVVVVGVTIVLTDLIIEAGGITVIFAMSLELAKDVVETIRRRPSWREDCDEILKDCLGTPLGGRWPWSWHESRCNACWLKCTNPKNMKWPEKIDLGDGISASCTDWQSIPR